jgi:hypothetical protein
MASSPATKRIDYPSLEEGWQRQPSGLSRHLDGDPIDEMSFVRVLRLERKRTDRSSTRFMLMVLDGEVLFRAPSGPSALAKIVSVLLSCSRETDTLGWYEHGTKLGIVFTEIGAGDSNAIGKIVERVTLALQQAVVEKEFKSLNITFRAFPGDSPVDSQPPPSDFTVYRDFSNRHSKASRAPFQRESEV